MAALEHETLARRKDPSTSQEAAAAVAVNLSELRLAVLELVAQWGPVSASRVNRLYRIHWRVREWPSAALDSPRKRAGWLADPAHGLLEVVGRTEGPNGVGESVYAVTEKGRVYLASRRT